MDRGALAFLDCLGFKGISGRVLEPERILEFLQESKANLGKSMLFSLSQSGLRGIAQKIVYISDTVAISTSHSGGLHLPLKVADGYAVLQTVHACTEVAKRFMGGPVPLMLRGHISVGPHIAKDSFLIGPAVDLAAERAELPQGAFIWLSPEAVNALEAYMKWNQEEFPRLFDSETDDQASNAASAALGGFRNYPPGLLPIDMALISNWWEQLTLKQRQRAVRPIGRAFAFSWRDDFVVRAYPMEMKGGGTLQADVVNPLYLVPPNDHVKCQDAILSSFVGPRVDVLMKKQNTERFLRQASKASRDAFEKSKLYLAALVPELEQLTGKALMDREQFLEFVRRTG